MRTLALDVLHNQTDFGTATHMGRYAEFEFVQNADLEDLKNTLEVGNIAVVVENVNSMMEMKSWLQNFMEWKKMEMMERRMDGNEWKTCLQIQKWVAG